MKKIFFLALGLLSASFANAEDILQVIPATIEAGYTENDYDEDHRFAVEIVSDVEDEFTALQFDMYLPEGLSILDDCIDLDDTRFNGKIIKKVWTPDAVAEITDKGNGHYLITLYDTNNQTIHGTEGAALYFYYTTTDAVANSVLPIVIKKIVLARPDETNVKYESTTSYLLCGTPSNATLALEGVVPSFVNEALASETAITSLDLSAVTASNGTFTYVNGREVVAPEGVTANVAVKTSATENNTYSSICLPYEATIENCYTFENVNGNKAVFTEAETLEANTPAIVKGAVDVNLGDQILASVEGQEVTTGYYLKNDNFCSVNTSATIPALRGYWNLGADIKGFVIDGNATAINGISADDANATIYNVAGVKLAKTQKGVNIVNGKKLIVK